MTARKPAIPPPQSATFLAMVKECLERVMGRRGSKVASLPPMTASQVITTPSADEFNALLADVSNQRDALNALLEQIEDTP